MINSESSGLSSIGWAVRGVPVASTFLVPVLIMKDKSATYDEVAHLPAGYTYLTTGIIKLNQKHPPLIKEICAFPLLFLDLKLLVDRKSLRGINTDPAYEWNYGRDFLYRDHDADRILFWEGPGSSSISQFGHPGECLERAALGPTCKPFSAFPLLL